MTSSTQRRVTPVIDTSEAAVTVEESHDPAVIHEARRLQAVAYLQRRYITPDQVIDGVMSPEVDPWVANSAYFVARDDTHSLVGVVRLILWDPQLTLPALEHCRIWPEQERYITALGPAVAEVSALAVDRGAPRRTALALYQAIWEYGRRHEQLMWLMLVDPPLRSLLHAMLGPITYPIGAQQWYMGGHLVPAAMRTCDTHAIISAFAQRRGRAGLGEAFPHNPAWDGLPDLGPVPDHRPPRDPSPLRDDPECL